MPERHFALIAEDTHDLASAIQQMLSFLEIDSHHAANGIIALECIAQRQPDILLLDIGMPGKSGWEVLEEVKKRYPQAQFPIIILTAFGDPANKLIGKLQPRVFRYITKPFDLLVLTETIREALQIN
jgi:DNA-binding response OmpR family regulator